MRLFRAAIAGCLALFAYPLVRDYAKVIHNPSSLPHNYTANLAVSIGIVWAALVTAALVAALRRRRVSKRQRQSVNAGRSGE